MAIWKRKHSPKSRSLYRKYIFKGKFNPYNPTNELLNELREWVTPSIRHIQERDRGLRLSTISMELLEYLAFDCVGISAHIQLLSAIQYYIKFAEDEDVTKEDVYIEITDMESCGLIPEIMAKYLRDELEIV